MFLHVGKDIAKKKRECEQRLRETQSQLEEVRSSIASYQSTASAPSATAQRTSGRNINPIGSSGIDSDSEALQKELANMKLEYTRLTEQMKNDEKRLQTHAGTLAKQLEKYRQKSNDSQKAIRELEDRNKELQSRLKRGNMTNTNNNKTSGGSGKKKSTNVPSKSSSLMRDVEALLASVLSSRIAFEHSKELQEKLEKSQAMKEKLEVQ